MEMRRLIGAYAALLYKTGKITHICRHKFHLRKLYHIMRYEGEWVVVSCRSLHRILTFAGSPWGPFKKFTTLGKGHFEGQVTLMPRVK